MLRTEDMNNVALMGDQPDTGSYLFRISEVKETNEAGEQLLSNKGEPKVIFVCKIQTEGKFLGTPVQIHASLQPHALGTVKAVYTACGYKPGPEGHDPQSVLDGEFYGYGEKKPYKDEASGETRDGFNIAPWNITSVAQGPKPQRSR